MANQRERPTDKQVIPPVEGAGELAHVLLGSEESSDQVLPIGISDWTDTPSRVSLGFSVLPAGRIYAVESCSTARAR